MAHTGIIHAYRTQTKSKKDGSKYGKNGSSEMMCAAAESNIHAFVASTHTYIA